MRTIRMLSILSVALFIPHAMGTAGDWTQWRGPFLNGTSDQTGLPDSLDPNTVLWKTALPGPGEATPAICGSRVYLSGYTKDTRTLFAMCLNAETGTPIWQKQAATFDKMPKRNVIASPSPVADENGVIFLFSEGTLVAFDTAGKERWKRNLVDAYGPFQMGWGYSSSPLLYDGRLYIAVMRGTQLPKDAEYTGSMTPYLLCVEPSTGENIFKVDRPTDGQGDAPDAYTTPVPVTVNGQKQILLYGGNYLTAHDPKNGTELWRHKYMDEDMRWRRTVAMPVVDGDRAYLPFSMGKKVVACELGALAAGKTDRLWVNREKTSDIPSPVRVGKHLYLIEDKQKTLTCMDTATGQKVWTGQLPKSDTYYASPTAADGKLYAVNRKGAVTVVAADPKAFRVLGSHRFDEDPVDSTIAVSKGRVYLRTAENLYCFRK